MTTQAMKLTENILFNYPMNIIKLAQIQREAEQAVNAVSSCRGGAFDMRCSGGVTSDAVADGVDRRADIMHRAEAKAAHLRQITEPITALSEYLTGAGRDSALWVLSEILDKYFFRRGGWQVVADTLSIGRTAFFKHKKRLITMAAEVLNL